MADGRKLGKGILVDALIKNEGYSEAKANKAVNALIDAIKKGLGSGKNVELEGIGTLRLVKRSTKRQVKSNLLGVTGPSVVPYSRHAVTVRLKPTLKLEDTDA